MRPEHGRQKMSHLRARPEAQAVGACGDISQGFEAPTFIVLLLSIERRPGAPLMNKKKAPDLTKQISRRHTAETTFESAQFGDLRDVVLADL